MITVVGGGPAGMSAALAGARAGAKVRLIESGPRLGGQYWRHLPEDGADGWTGQATLNSAYQQGYLLRSQVLSHPSIEVLCSTQIWSAVRSGDTFALHVLESGVTRTLETRSLILATGAYDRTLPFPGWEIPGVITPGGVQALLKGANVLAGKRIVLAGSGPFLLPVADGLAKSGAEIVALVDANSSRKWSSHLGVVIRNFSKIREGFKYLLSLASHRIYLKSSRAVISAHAGLDGTLESVVIAKIDRHFNVIDGTQKSFTCDVVAVGWGFTPDLSIAQSLGLQQELGSDGSAVVSVDELQATNQSGIFAAGEVTGIGGADLSLTEGAIAGSAAAALLKKVDVAVTRKKLTDLIKRREREREFARTIAKIYKVQDGWRSWLTDESIICRCEEVSLGSLKVAIHELGATNLRSAKLFCRIGMGACQGRICSRSAISIVGAENKSISTTQDYLSANSRPIIAPITLGQLAAGASDGL